MGLRIARPLAVVVLAASCAAAPRITIDADSTSDRITFSLTRGHASEPASIAAFRVDGCTARGSPAPESHWLTLAPDTAESVARITYGTPPTGWRSVQGPQPIVPGCYRAAVASAPPLEFDVLVDGTVKARR